MVDLEEGWLDKFLELPTDKLAKLLADIYVARNWTKTPKNPKTKSYHA